jgi:hypothetical protein
VVLPIRLATIARTAWPSVLLEERLDRCELGLAPDDARHAESTTGVGPEPEPAAPPDYVTGQQTGR